MLRLLRYESQRVERLIEGTSAGHQRQGNDPLEHEADRVADRVMRINLTWYCGPGVVDEGSSHGINDDII